MTRRLPRPAPLAACVLALALPLAACGEKTDAEKIRDVIVLSVTLPNGDDCDNAFADVGLRQRFAKAASADARNACHAYAASPDKPTADDVHIESIHRISEFTASAIFDVKGVRAKVHLSEEGGYWKIDAYYVLNQPPPPPASPPTTATTPTATTTATTTASSTTTTTTATAPAVTAPTTTTTATP